MRPSAFPILAAASKLRMIRLRRPMKKETAIQINELMLEFSKNLAGTCALIKEECANDEVEAYMKPAAHISALIFDMLDIIYLQHPDLKLPKFD